MGSEELEPGLVLLNPGTELPELGESLNQLFESEAPPKGAAAQVPGQIVYGGFDLNSVTTFYLTVDLKPGNYYIVAEDADAEDTPAASEGDPQRQGGVTAQVGPSGAHRRLTLPSQFWSRVGQPRR
ncbi:MAG: hypothetical protein ACR2HV_11095 [Acidimicrobiales bacterium]